MAASSRSRLPATVLALGFTSFFTDVASEMVFPLLPAFLVTLGAGPTFLGVLEGVADALSAILKYQAGAWSDRLPKKKPLVLFGYGLATVVRPLFAVAAAPWHVLSIRLLDRVGKGVRSAPRDVLIAGAVDKAEAGRAFGFHRAMDHAGAVVGPLVATALLALGLSTREVFAWTLVPGVLAVAMVLWAREPPPPPVKEAPAAPAARLPPRLKWFLAVLLLFALGNSSDAFLLLRARELGTPDVWLPVLWVALHLSKMLWTSLGGAWSDRLPRHRLLFAGWGVYAATYLALGVSTQAWQVWALFLVYGVFYGLTEPVEKALIGELAPEALRGKAFGLYHAILGASAIPAGLLTGALWQWVSPFAALATGAGIAAASALLLALWARRAGTRQPW